LVTSYFTGLAKAISDLKILKTFKKKQDFSGLYSGGVFGLRLLIMASVDGHRFGL